ncbi:hypothetical protein N7495_004413 [Penicillium taxi]|uniref:uncharacterized protein n=1 Tax=Penicillium taxi TaxID=168475 RepID=UPI002545181F|nr:uncharacterized protein N7495_004413 [Penicillium taxi]KAJ5899669.1 hypothetical protein N7495_004413 [Penicillium taxi]
MISRAAAPSTSSLSHFTTRALRTQGTTARSFATVQEAPPVRHYGGLKDQDRIFTNLYAHHGTDLKSAMKYGDWYRTKDIVLKGDDWVGVQLLRTRRNRGDNFFTDAFLNNSSFPNLRPLAYVVVVVPVSPPD